MIHRSCLGEEQRKEALWLGKAACATGLRQERLWQVGRTERRVLAMGEDGAEMWLSAVESHQRALCMV